MALIDISKNNFVTTLKKSSLWAIFTNQTTVNYIWSLKLKLC
jgi:hypothetical protein